MRTSDFMNCIVFTSSFGLENETWYLLN